jgi:hypothetical protein
MYITVYKRMTVIVGCLVTYENISYEQHEPMVSITASASSPGVSRLTILVESRTYVNERD